MELSQRKREILKQVISTYIVTGEPVGSKAVMEQMKKPCSSATIRNEMNELEKLGLLEQPHTSAGRIPTGRGYRMYVDSLMEEYRLSFEETLHINSFLSKLGSDVDTLTQSLAELIAQITGYTAITYAKERTGTIERFEGVYIHPHSFLLVMITSSGKAISRQLQSLIPITPEGCEFLIRTVNDHLAKKELGGITMERMFAMEKDLGEYKALISLLLQAVYDATAEVGKVHVAVRGTANLFVEPSLAEAGNAHRILRELEDEGALLERLHQDFSSNSRVRIASDGEGLARTSFVVCPFRMGKDLDGALCVVGPKRMNYAKAMARLEYLARQIHTADGFDSPLPMIETKEK